MKLVYLIHSLCNAGGVERVLTAKANFLVDHYGYDITIITAKQRGLPPYFALNPSVRLIDLDVNFYSRIRLPRYMKRLEAVLMSLKCDICCSLTNYEIYGLSKIKDGSVKIAEYHFSHDRWFLEKGRHSLKAAVRVRRLENAIRKVDKFVVLTRADAETWKRIRPDVKQIYNPCTYKIGHAALDAKEFIATGRLCRQKNYRPMIQAWRMVADKHPDWKLRIFGRGGELDELLQLISGLGLQDKVTIEKPVKDIREVMLKSSGLLMTSRYEGFPMVMLEALSQGLPLVSFNCECGPSEIIEEGVNGYLVNPDDTVTFADRINFLIENPGARKEMGAASSRLAEQFSEESIIARWHQLFSESLENRR